MTERATFLKAIISSDDFLNLPLSAQALYFHLNISANEKGVLYCPKTIAKYIGADESDYRLLLNKRFITQNKDVGITITHWREHNGIGGNAKKRISYSYRQWRRKVLERDHYTCQNCGSKDKLHVHHIKSFSEYPELREEISNGVTLCEKCHRKLHGLYKGE